ncbi:hypothetical protein M2323_004372 [Rhodoblastus acidophilus]|uniref:hypothetical protein n=1 Tax=Rhodoblastus acidophilus TaxID=1074 RepID=UPI0022241150|nr:hypothetical protein [Rhodoblastus acidophilus]MCW2286606.1 hypothetical protein [Rhodoblastus acidophilus]MCW2335424.1 hypothetical protein [Rhodoblastus acidophilus]
MDNIDHFNTLTGLIFDELYRSFPLPISYFHGDKALATMGVEISYTTSEFFDEELPNEYGNLPGTEIKSYRFLIETLSWLRTEGFILADGDHANRDVVLTSKALTALNATPATLKGEESLGKQIGKAAKNVGAETGKQTIGQLVSWVFGFAVKGYFGG